MVTKKINIERVPREKIIRGHFKQVLISDNKRNIQVLKITVEPDAQGLEHKHSNNEWVYIAKGSMIDNSGEHRQGNLLFNKAGSKHAVKAGHDGYEIIVFFIGKSDSNPHLSKEYRPSK